MQSAVSNLHFRCWHCFHAYEQASQLPEHFLQVASFFRSLICPIFVKFFVFCLHWFLCFLSFIFFFIFLHEKKRAVELTSNRRSSQYVRAERNLEREAAGQSSFGSRFLSTNQGAMRALHKFQPTRFSLLRFLLCFLWVTSFARFTVLFFEMSARDIYYGPKYPDSEGVYEYRWGLFSFPSARRTSKSNVTTSSYWFNVAWFVNYWFSPFVSDTLFYRKKLLQKFPSG